MLRPMPPRVPVGSIRHRPPGHLRPPPTLHTTLLLTSTLRHHYSISSPDARAHSLKSSYSKQRHQSWSAPAATMGAQNSNKVGPAGTAAVQTGGPQVLPADKAPWEGGAVESQMQHRGRKSSIIISSKSSGGSGGSSSSGGSNSSGSVEPDGASTNSSGTSGGSNSSGGSDGSSGSGSATPGGRGSSSSSSSRGGTDGKGGSSGSGSVTPGDPYSSISNSSVGSSASSAGGTAPWEVTPAAASPKKRKSSSSSSSSSSKGGRGKEASPSSGILNGVGGSGGSGPAGSERRQGTSGAPVANNQDKGLLLLIDGHSMAHRSFGAMAHSKIGGLKTSQGISTSATAGFLKTITAAVRDQKPSAMAITFDDAISFRKPMHALLSYLADEQRSGMSDDEYVDMVKGICTLLKPPTPEAAAQAAQQQLGVGVPPSVAVDVRMLPGMVAAKLSKEVAQTALTAPDEEGKGYKATRKERPMGFDEDVHNLRQLLSAMRLPVISGGGSSLEADDLLAGLATQGAAAGYEVKIVSGDQDLLQLVDDRKRISVLEPSGPQTPRSAGSSAFKQLDETGVVAKLGVLPTQVPDYKAMVGDASDNVPGVAGIGPKNGHSLLASYGSLDGVYSNLSKISKGMRTKLEQGRRKAYMSRFLCALSDERLLNAGLHTGIFANIDALRLQGFHKAEVEPLMEALEMNSALKTLPTLQALLGGEAAQPSTSPLTPRDLILSPPPLEQPSALSSSIAEAGNRLVGAGSNVADAGDHWAESGRASAGADALSHAAASASSQQAGVGSAPNVTGSQSPAAPDAGSHQAGAGSVTFAVPDAQSHAAVEAADRCMGEAEGTAAAAAGNAQAATAAQQHAAATAAAAAAEATPGAAAAPAIADLHFLPGPRTPARSRAVTDQAPLPAANANGTTPAGGKKATVSVSAAGTRRRRTVRGVPSLSPSSPSPPPSSQHADLTARSPASGSPSLTPAAEGSVAQAPAECPGTPATPEIAASSPAAAVARSAGKVQEPTAVAPPPLPPGGAERNDVAIAAAAAPTVSMPFRPPPEPLVRVPESGIPYRVSTSVAGKVVLGLLQGMTSLSMHVQRAAISDQSEEIDLFTYDGSKRSATTRGGRRQAQVPLRVATPAGGFPLHLVRPLTFVRGSSLNARGLGLA
ncbi:hypothetical protein DUNSADRAFT_17090 [Dunaliella salina]|uniref:5'-3' exonuclease domain-containing protein n=1 Tax=Dunaliella salina TaxID=3046 RepID=A0ABQ7G2G5_DUNSA|nr:hypothetical protein DUNSADRAFT_17090 [Dunaliella salina]|eukprot:KAF5828785.1 hypothetical protein DUNSADRAFT_17090 [Dunaliella salina]